MKVIEKENFKAETFTLCSFVEVLATSIMGSTIIMICMKACRACNVTLKCMQHVAYVQYAIPIHLKLHVTFFSRAPCVTLVYMLLGLERGPKNWTFLQVSLEIENVAQIPHLHTMQQATKCQQTFSASPLYYLSVNTTVYTQLTVWGWVLSQSAVSPPLPPHNGVQYDRTTPHLLHTQRTRQEFYKA